MKRVLCLLLCVALLSSFLPVFAYAAENRDIPIVHIYGFMSCPILADANDPDSQRLFPMEKDAILQFVRDLVPAVSAFSVNKNWVKFGDRLIPALNKLMMPVANDTRGVPQNGSGPYFDYPTAEEIAQQHAARFVYDWRDDPFVSAQQLDRFVRYITDDCGFEKVALECHSYGGVVTLTYLAAYGTERIHSCCFNATAVYGATFAGELMQGKVHLSTDALTAFLEGLFDQKEYEALLQAVVALFDEMGGIRFICNFINQVFVHLSDRIWNETIFPVFTHWVSVWSMVPDDQLENAKQFIASNARNGSAVDNAVFTGKVERFNREIRSQRETLLRRVNDACSLYVIARYGYSGVPLEEIWEANTDGVLDTRCEAFGAICKPFGYFVPPIQTVQYVSPNGAIDASTCLFPQQTWFVRNFKHTQKEPAMEEFTGVLLRSKTQMTIYSCKQYPQFLYFDKMLRAVRADSNQIESIGSWYQDLLKLLRKLFFRLLDRWHIPHKWLEVRATDGDNAGYGWFVPTVNPGVLT